MIELNALVAPNAREKGKRSGQLLEIKIFLKYDILRIFLQVFASFFSLKTARTWCGFELPSAASPRCHVNFLRHMMM
jgi:hypothetical protein